jgi:Cu-Zn family superoxide dismutase
MTTPAASQAIAVLRTTKGNQAAGWVRFDAVEGGVRVTAVVEGLSPNGTHAFHLHEFGDMRSDDGTSAGGHYNPGGHPHAGPDAAARHAGDFGNLQADANGRATYDRTFTDLCVEGGPNPAMGRAVVVHAKADDFVTQPTGNAGARIAYGVVGVAKPDAPAK